MFVKTKLTLTVEEESVLQIKQFARRKGVSVSWLFEQWSTRVALADHGPPLSSRLRGQWKSETSDKGDPRLDFLLEKYGG